MPQHRVLCKYFLHGACFKGDSCEFSHSFSDPENNVCTFYQRGCCSYGSRCRYEHVKISRPQLPYVPPFSASSRNLEATKELSRLTIVEELPSTSESPNSSKPSIPPLLNAWQKVEQPYIPPDVDVWENLQSETATQSIDMADKPICSFAAAGFCPYGDACPHLHGDLCDICKKHCLHPYRPAEREEHNLQCQRNQKRLESLRMSQDVECSVCLERVLSKPSVAERKFGLLSGCDHPFCISCIRDWRGGSRPGMDLDTVVRACPVCRISSHFVIPSVVWYSTPDEKEEIIRGYKNKLSLIDCKYFDFGNATCPFGTSCFYKHAYIDGRKEEVKLRHLGAADGSTVIAKNIRLSDFLVNARS